MEEGEIEEGCSARLSRSETRWVDGSEVDSESPPWSLQEDESWGGVAAAAYAPGEGSLRRRLFKKPPRVDSLDVEAMGIADSHKHRKKVVPF